jgi:ketosteroid isomerase-like protein
MMAEAQDRAALLNADQRFFDALQRQDLGALEALLADDFVIVAINDGSVADRSTLLTAMREGQLQFQVSTASLRRRWYDGSMTSGSSWAGPQ